MRDSAPLVIAASIAASLLLPAPAAAAPQTHIVVMDKMKFGPVPARLRRGDIIVWVNKDMVRHTATAKDGSFNVDLPPGAKGRTVLRSSGAVAVLCKYHPGMRTMLKVAAR